MLVYVKLLCTAFFWGGTFVAGRAVTQHMGPFSAAFLRFALASVRMWVVVRRREGGLPRLDRRQIIPVILLGMTGVFAYNAFFFTGLKTVEAGRAAVIVATNPIFIAMFAALIFKESLSRMKIAGILMSVCGAILAITRGQPWNVLDSPLSPGDVAIFGCVASWVSYSLLGKHAMNRLSPHGAVCWSCLVGAAALFVPACFEGLLGQIASFPVSAWGELFYLGVFGTVIGFTWFYQGVKIIGPSRAGVFINFVPVTAILAGWAVLGEPASLSLILGGVLVSSGVYMTNRG